MIENYLRLQQVLLIMNVGKTLFYKLRLKHSLPYYLIDGTKAVIYKESDIRAFMQQVTSFKTKNYFMK